MASRHFRRYHPSINPNTYEHAEAAPEEGVAETYPTINGVYIPWFVPQVGDNWLDALTHSSLLGLLQIQWFLHEFLHVMIGMTEVGTLLRRLGHSVYLVLYTLDNNMALRVPSWQLEGHQKLARLTPRLYQLLDKLNDEAVIPEEAICISVTLLNLRAFLLSGRLTRDRYREIVDIIPIGLKRNRQEEAWRLSQRLTGLRWFSSLSSYLQVHMLLYSIGLYVFDSPAERLKEWWEKGDIPEGQGPRARFDYVAEIVQDTGSVEEAIEKLRAAKVIQGPGNLGQIMDAAEKMARNASDPFAEVIAALDLDSDNFYFADPVGRAIYYLNTGYAARSKEEAERILAPWPFSNWSFVVPILTQEQGVDRRCRYMARFPFGSMASQMFRGYTEPEGIWEKLLRGESPGIRMSRVTIMPAVKEVKLLWDLEQIRDQLMFDAQLRCLCGSLAECDLAGACSCHGLLSRVYEHTRTDEGGYLPSVPCLSAS